ncbi:MAG: hypothetical protein PUF71_00560 [Firmicutes bacterium]|nr:hypothetical protein [Bacillota bacterium]
MEIVRILCHHQTKKIGTVFGWGDFTVRRGEPDVFRIRFPGIGECMIGHIGIVIGVEKGFRQVIVPSVEIDSPGFHTGFNAVHDFMENQTGLVYHVSCDADILGTAFLIGKSPCTFQCICLHAVQVVYIPEYQTVIGTVTVQEFFKESVGKLLYYAEKNIICSFVFRFIVNRFTFVRRGIEVGFFSGENGDPIRENGNSKGGFQIHRGEIIQIPPGKLHGFILGNGLAHGIEKIAVKLTDEDYRITVLGVLFCEPDISFQIKDNGVQAALNGNVFVITGSDIAIGFCQREAVPDGSVFVPNHQTTGGIVADHDILPETAMGCRTEKAKIFPISIIGMNGNEAHSLTEIGSGINQSVRFANGGEGKCGAQRSVKLPFSVFIKAVQFPQRAGVLQKEAPIAETEVSAIVFRKLQQEGNRLLSANEIC